MQEADIVVVGGGLSGLYAALTLRDAGRSVIVLEARERVGGLTYSPLSKVLGSRVDLGGQWAAPRHQRMSRLIARYRVPLVKQFIDGQRACLQDKDTYFGPMGTVPGLSAKETEEYGSGIKRLYDAMDGLAENPWESQDAARLDSMTFASWIDQVAMSERPRASFFRMPGAYYGALAEEISALELLHKLRSCGGPLWMSDANEGGQSRHMMGSQLVSEGIAAELGDAVHTSSPVRAISWSADSATVRSDSIAVRCKRVICATSPAMISQVAFDPPLPAPRRLLHQRFANGRNTKAAIIYERPFWRDRGLNGNIIATDGSLTATYDLGGEAPRYGILIALFTGRPAYQIDALTPEMRRTKVLGLLAQALGPEATQPLEYMDQVWANEEWSGGASSPFLLPGAMTTIGADLRSACGPIHWAGTHMSSEFRGYMEGALAAGEAAANRVLAEK
ncbi:flavin monoamine oxidase family protein [Dongia sedimenti]|uniref:FAD-dependent oxidoreductase n=1 Tax=Dongia sedimenti TaxID=3064282 RepID=A0ABU0YSG7_9PROT|nr:FAD-dependent oxidoreductase [Rhodospirillaceae bacterium R-7]